MSKPRKIVSRAGTSTASTVDAEVALSGTLERMSRTTSSPIQ